MDKTMNNQELTGEETVLQEPQAEEQNNVENAPKEGTGGLSWKTVVLGGIPGILLGVGGVLATQGFTVPDDNQEVEHTDGFTHVTEHTEEDDGKDIPVAHSPNDSMSFREAFEAAREEVGPGGAFAWHGNVYSTYRADDPEWVQMGPSGQAAHCHDIVVQVHAEPYHAAADHPVTDHVNEDVHDDQTADITDNSNDDSDVDVRIDEDSDDIDSGEVDVHIIGVETDAESGASAAYGYVDGHATVFLDEDGDGEVDYVIHDADNDGNPSDDEIIPVSGSGVTIDELSNEIDTGNDVQLYEDQPDYTNDVSPDFNNEADVSDF